MNLATKYAKPIDERWTLASRVSLVTGNNKYNFKGDKTVVIYSIPTAPLINYTRSGSNRYGTPDDLGRNIQTLVVSQDKSFNFVIDKGDEIQSEYASNPGTALAAQIKSVMVPAYDRYCFKVMADSAHANGSYNSTAVTASNAYEMVLKGCEFMGDRNVPVDECVLYVCNAMHGYLLRDPAFVKYSNVSQEMVRRGEFGMCAGMRTVSVPNDRLPVGTAFLIVHRDAIVAPKQLEEYRVHDNPPGISGYLCEGRAIYDCFVLDEKKDGVYCHGGQSVIGMLSSHTAATGTAQQTKLIVDKEKDYSNGYIYFITASSKQSLPTATYGTAIDTTATGDWYGATSITTNPQTISSIASGHKYYAVVETDSSKYPLYYGTGKINI